MTANIFLFLGGLDVSVTITKKIVIVFFIIFRMIGCCCEDDYQELVWFELQKVPLVLSSVEEPKLFNFGSDLMFSLFLSPFRLRPRTFYFLLNLILSWLLSCAESEPLQDIFRVYFKVIFCVVEPEPVGADFF